MDNNEADYEVRGPAKTAGSTSYSPVAGLKSAVLSIA